MSAGIVFQLVAALAYALLGAASWRQLARGHDSLRVGPATHGFLAAALAAQAIGLHQSMLGHVGGLHVGWALALSAAIWLGMLVFWVENFVMRLDGLLLMLLPAAALAALLGGIFPGGRLVPHGESQWLRTHLIIALCAYGLIAVATLHALFMASLDRQLHQPAERTRKQSLIGQALDSLPPLLVQEQLLFRLVWIGFGVLTLTVITGAIVSLQTLGVLFPLDHKTIFTLLAWFTFGGLLLGRHIRGWRGRTALRWTLVGFAFVLLSYSGSRFVLDVLLQRG
ncbi:cytochrome c biogenesis protein CcsA [Yanghanlia caeni]|uniref:Cytochrome c biogenesis protein CcsA n=1 Tax=Yanghanlia caeni TaxID=3064283 RepID=A0ABU1D4Q5_9BURK|nr:cytochrome c biogenesis protein CcsA [Alcaligenaceae bacterium LG-2]NGR07793.1 cytochrome c biogenesis protein CcsA [bacterium SGD-2]HZH57332.1 cytochrome c biogenesis protein CcsA [Burkholderiaceae bacterium]